MRTGIVESMFRFPGSLLDNGLGPGAGVETIRQYRLTNGLNLSFAVIALSAVPVILAFGNLPLFFIPLQLTCFSIYLLGFFLTGKRKLGPARNTVILTFELQIAAICLFSLTKNPDGSYISPGIYSFAIFPLLAAIVEQPIILHVGISLLTVLLIRWIGYLPDPVTQWFPRNGHSGMSSEFGLMIAVYLPIISGILVGILHRENTHSKELIRQEIVQKEELNRKMSEEMRNKSEAVREKNEAEIQLESKVRELEKMNAFMVGREIKMKSLKEEIERLKKTP